MGRGVPWRDKQFLSFAAGTDTTVELRIAERVIASLTGW
jgi:hypothetical protein